MSDDRDGKSKESSAVDPDYPSQADVEEVDEDRRKHNKSNKPGKPSEEKDGKARVHESGSVQRD